MSAAFSPLGLAGPDIRTKEYNKVFLDFRTYNPFGAGRWVAYVGQRPLTEDDGIWECGDSEDEVLVAIANRMGWRLWFEEASSASPLNSRSTKPKLR